MNAAALLGRLKPAKRERSGPGLLARLRRRKAGGDSDDAPRARKERRPLSPLAKRLLGAYAALALGLGGLGGWLAMNGEHTTEAWRAAIPRVEVAVKGAQAPAPSAPPPAAVAAVPVQPAPPTAAPAMAPPPAAVAPPPLAVAVNEPVTLTPAPVPGLVEDSRNGPLPRIAEDGRKPWQVYARPFPAADRRPRIAIVLAEMGISGVTTGNALQKLPPTITLAFVPYAERLDNWVERARGKGHEVMLSIPMEPQDYPRNDPGPNALLSMLPPERNMERLEWSLGKAVGYVGITSTTGSKFTANPDAVNPVVAAMKARGLMVLDARANPRSVAGTLAGQAGVPRAFADRVIDRDLSRGAIDDQLAELEAIAKANGAAVGIGAPYPSTIERINLWLTGLADRGIAIVPVSAVANMQKQ
ncbi:divergent polysaccharide deacetylase family protein [Azospirillum brasilense]|uniref:Divergent polysaccharide deacetylase family protein n=1 Tax=Azospirillum brasilense TaxID=192 RepID=A0A4D8QYA5_AZOBR|nr:divergent polysaccharide deacetylase family protein [Azospirillum brasilense]QCO14691.1 divergent polysaccharide deacetylase family protein [Azospirillum brasilense]